MWTEYYLDLYSPTQFNIELSIYPICLGHLKANENYRYKSRIIDNYSLIYVSDGKGGFSSGGKNFNLKKNDIFFLFPGELHSYATDRKSLMELWWFDFNGSFAKNIFTGMEITPVNPIIYNVLSEGVFSLIKEMVLCGEKESPSLILKQSGNILKLFSILTSQYAPIKSSFLTNRNLSEPIQRAIKYMETNYPFNISINHIADYAGFSRSHFFVRFKKETGISPSDYLAQIRLNKAAEYLKKPDIYISEVAYSVGFEDPLYFSKIFKKKFNMTPSEYRNKNEF